MVEKKGKPSKPWNKPVVVSGLTTGEVSGKMKELGEKAKEVRGEGSIPAQALLQRRYQRRLRGTGP